MNGGTLEVNGGSTLTTNQMKLANDSKVNVVGPGSSYTINGKENVMSGNAQIAVTGGGNVTLAEGAGIKHGRRDEGQPVYRACEEGWHGL